MTRISELNFLWTEELFQSNDLFYMNTGKGLSHSSLKPSGTHPSMSEKLTNFVIEGSSISQHFLIRNVGHGSNRQDFVGEFLIILPTSFSET